MPDDTNPTSGGTIDLRSQKGGTPSSGATGGAKPGDDQSLFSKFDIPETVKKQYPDLIPLILETESMNDDERQYWFQILPIMTDEQVGKLREILVNEKKQLQQLDKEYEQEIKRINTKHVAEWKEFEVKEKRKKLRKAESKSEKEETKKQEELLKKLQEL